MLVSAAATDEGVVVSWSPPVSDGGYLVLYYTVYGLDGLGLWQEVGNAAANATSLVLDQAESSVYMVTATNEEGEGPYSAPASTTTSVIVEIINETFGCVPLLVSIDTAPPFLHSAVDWNCIEQLPP
jgi:hypothetical protein